MLESELYLDQELEAYEKLAAELAEKLKDQDLFQPTNFTIYCGRNLSSEEVNDVKNKVSHSGDP